jgi:septum site-determining protein MinC
LRSGQRLYAQGRDAVVVAPTSRGSELIADGSIYAFSPLRGRVLAGAGGDTSACIVATHLDAELVAVGGVYRTLEPEDLKAHGSGPVSVTLSLDPEGGERLTLAALAPSPSMQRK